MCGLLNTLDDILTQLFNFLQLTGIIFLLIGITVLVRYSQYEELITNRFFNLTGFVIATAVIILVGSLLGFYGAISRHFYVVSAVSEILFFLLFMAQLDWLNAQSHEEHLRNSSFFTEPVKLSY